MINFQMDVFGNEEKDIICRGTSLSKDLDLNMCRLFSGSGKY